MKINKICLICNVNLEKDIIALNKKLLGRHISDFYCLKCLADYLELPEELLKDKIKEFKNQGCSLFS